MKRIGRIGITLGLLLGLAAGCGRAGDEQTARPAKESTAKAAAAATAAATVYRVPIDGAPVKGDRAALVTLVAFSDYECPFCARGNATIEQLQKTYGKKLRVVARHNPLPFHAHAEPAALAAMAALEQGRFWEMHERLFANARSLDDESLDRIAGEVGLDVARFRAARQGPDARAAIERERALSASLGVRGTPAFFINGRKVEGARPIDDFKAIINEEIQKAEALVARGVRPLDVYDALMKDAVTPKAVPAEKAAVKSAPGAQGGTGECGGGAGCDCDHAEAPAVSDQIEDVSVGAAPAWGPADAKVTVVIFSDFECPFCNKTLGTLRSIEQQYPGKVRFAFRNHPLPFHTHARLAAKAALAAGEQGRFWEYHDALFSHQDALTRPSLERYAADLGLDLARFRAALDDSVLDAALEADSDDAGRLHVQGTPTFFVNGRRIIGAQPLEVFRGAVDKALAEASR
jgi:protein-disulfide isomerase